MPSSDYGSKTAQEQRAQWLRVLALADAERIDQHFKALQGVPAYRFLRQPETGMAMVRARTGGTGAQFNLGEITISRCTVVMADSDVVGIAHVQGRSLRHAEQAAVLDALLQTPQWHARLYEQLIQALEEAHAAARDALAQAAASTKVEFFTLARGDE